MDNFDKFEKIDHESINTRAQEMVNDIIDLEPRTTLENTFCNISLKTGVKICHIRRIYYKSWRMIPAFVWEQLRRSHAKLIDQAYKNMKHKLDMIKKKSVDLEKLNQEDKKILRDISNTLARIKYNDTKKIF